MATSPASAGGGVLRLGIRADGQVLDASVRIVSVVVDREVDRVASATIVVLDGDPAEQSFPVSDDSALAAGSTIEISAGYDDAQEMLFKGIVVRHAIAIAGANDSRLEIHCQDEAVKMTAGRRSARWENAKDSDVIAALAADAGLVVECAPTRVVHPELVQHDCTDWDLMLMRADANGLVVSTNDGTLQVKAPDDQAAPVHTVTWGTDIIEFHAELDARSQFAAVASRAWDPATLEVVEVEAGPSSPAALGIDRSADLAEVLGLSRFELQSSSPLPRGEVEARAQSQQTRAALARICGQVTFQGSKRVLPGTVLELAGVGRRFCGNAYVTAVRHELADGAWTTKATFGLPSKPYAARADQMSPPASGRLPGIQGLQVGIVEALEGDPQSWQRIQVRLPTSGPNVTVWARLASLQASGGFGALFLPHVGDEVVVGFFDDDPNFPVVLGSLYGPKHPPAADFTNANVVHEILTKQRLRLRLDDETRVITIETPAGNSVSIDDEGKAITLTDESGNKVVLDPSGISLASPGDIALDARGSVRISAVQHVTLNGMDVSLTADAGFAAKGSASAELSSSGITKVVGSLVNIN